MTDIAALIERLCTEAKKFQNYPPAYASLACLLFEAAEAFSRLTTPPPDEIAGLIAGLERLARQAEFAPGWSADRTLHGKAAAALRAQAQENERLKRAQS